MVKPAIFQIVGFQNSGKTTLMKNLIEQLQLLSTRVVTIKHHGHGGPPMTVKGKDSALHLQAGAMAAIVEGAGTLLLEAQQKEWSLEEKINLAAFFKPEVILIEGHKYAQFPKAVLLRSADDLHLLEELKEIKAVIVWEETLTQIVSNKNIPCFHINNNQALKWLVEYITNEIC